MSMRLDKNMMESVKVLELMWKKGNMTQSRESYYFYRDLQVRLSVQ